MATTVQESIDVHVPIRTAYNQWTQFESFPNFMDGVESIAQLDDTHTHWKIKVGGQEREFDASITEQRPDERVAWKSTGGTQHAGVVTFHRLTDDDTRVTVQMDWQPEGFAEKAGAAIGADDRRVKADLRRFKSFIEHRESETGSWRGEVPRVDEVRAGDVSGTQPAGSAPGYGDSASGQGHGTDPGHGAPAGGQGYGSPGTSTGRRDFGDEPGYSNPSGSTGDDAGFADPGSPLGGRRYGDDAGYGAPGGAARDQGFGGEPSYGDRSGADTPRSPGSAAGGW